MGNMTISTMAKGRMRLFGWVLFTVVFAGVVRAQGQNRVTARDFTVEPATLMALGFEWRIEADANRNASVAVAYRKRGTEAWKEGLPFHRIQNERTGNFPPEDGRWLLAWEAPNMFAGSIFDLEPATAYDVRVTLSDPDGVVGQNVQQVTVSTRPEPMPAAGGRIYHVYPYDYSGPRQEPAFNGLKAAYFTASLSGDRYNNFPVRVQPGDVILVHGGLYKVANRFDYNARGCCETNWDSTYYLTGKGTADKPIVIKAAGDGEVIFDGNGNAVLFNLVGSAYNYFEGITFQNTEVAIVGGWKDVAGTTGLTVKHSKFLNVGRGIHADWQGAKNFYIADNVFEGKNERVFSSGFRGAPALSEYSIKIYGSGHVVAYNRVRDFHDGMDFATFGVPYPEYMPVSNDFYNNDVANTHDDCIETDGSSYNMRVLRNHCVNTNSGFSSQPTFGGPTYVIRNVVYAPSGAQYGAVKTFDSQGWTVLNNTFIIHETGIGNADANSHFRNNLFLAPNPKVPVFVLTTLTSYSTSDYNGFMAGREAPEAFVLTAPAPGTGFENDRSKLVTGRFKTLEDYRQPTGREAHSLMVDFSVFKSLQPPDPSTPTRLYDPNSLDFSLNPQGKAVDAGMVLPNITDGFIGQAPDLGAYEIGHPIPHYGPRERPRDR